MRHPCLSCDIHKNSMCKSCEQCRECLKRYNYIRHIEGLQPVEKWPGEPLRSQQKAFSYKFRSNTQWVQHPDYCKQFGYDSQFSYWQTEYTAEGSTSRLGAKHHVSHNVISNLLNRLGIARHKVGRKKKAHINVDNDNTYC